MCVGNTLIWTGTFSTMAGQEQMTVGYYGNLGASDQGTYSPIYGGLFWRLAWSMCEYCQWTTGWFVVDSVTYSEGSLNSIQLRFAQYCGGHTSALYGALNWAATNPSDLTEIVTFEDLTKKVKIALKTAAKD